MDDEGTPAQWPLAVTREDFRAVRNDADGQLPAPLPLVAARNELNHRDGFELTEVDVEIRKKHWSQLAGHFLIDRTGIIRLDACRGGTCHQRLWELPGRQRHPGGRAWPGARLSDHRGGSTSDLCR